VAGVLQDGRTATVRCALLDGDRMASLGREFGISRKTGYTLFRRYRDIGLEGLTDRSRRPTARPTSCPSRSRAALLDRHGLVRRRHRRRYKAEGTPLSRPLQPNDLWCADFKGEFMLADHRYCYPLTITDFASRYLLACEALSSTRESTAFTVFERASKDLGGKWASNDAVQPPAGVRGIRTQRLFTNRNANR
jgi:putative transposase